MTHPSLHAKSTPDKIAYRMAGSGDAITYRDLDRRSNQGAQLFRKLGLKTGDAIAIFMENNARFLDICWAAQRAGLYYTCISSRLTARRSIRSRPRPCPSRPARSRPCAPAWTWF